MTYRPKFRDLNISVRIKDVPENSLDSGLFTAREEELREYKLSIKDSYGNEGVLPRYTPLFYTIADVSLISSDQQPGLGISSIENYQTTPKAVFEFKIEEDAMQLASVELPAIPVISMEVHYHMPGPESCHATHGYFDLEERTCVTIHRLSKVCASLVYDDELQSFRLEEGIQEEAGDESETV